MTPVSITAEPVNRTQGGDVSAIYDCSGTPGGASDAGEMDGGGSGRARASKGTATQQSREEKARDLAERMKPRPCKLPTCQKQFVPKRRQDWKSNFCCKDHQQKFWIEANRLSAAVISGGDLPLSVVSEYRPGVSHTTQVLELLQRGEWVNLKRALPEVVAHSRVADLREKGYEIESRVVGERPFKMEGNRRVFLPGGTVEYQYRLVKGDS